MRYGSPAIPAFSPMLGKRLGRLSSRTREASSLKRPRCWPQSIPTRLNFVKMESGTRKEGHSSLFPAGKLLPLALLNRLVGGVARLGRPRSTTNVNEPDVCKRRSNTLHHLVIPCVEMPKRTVHRLNGNLHHVKKHGHRLIEVVPLIGEHLCNGG